MTGKLRKKWLHLYECAGRIRDLAPWEIFGEGDKFAYVWKAKDKVLYFSFVAESAGRLGIACYECMADYARARKRLTTPNRKHEPTFFLQDAYVCLWGNREDLRKPTYELIKELGFSFRGKGAWLYFQRYETGYEPELPNERDLDIMIEGFENLCMMVLTVREGSVDPQFEKGYTLTRWYEVETRLYYTHPFEMPEPAVPTKEIRIKKGPEFVALLNTPVKKAVWELDWSYMPELVRGDDGRWEFSLLLICVDEESQLVLYSDVLGPSPDTAIGPVITKLCRTMLEFGRPTTIAVCDDDLKAIVADLCREAKVKISARKRLSIMESVRNEMFKMM